MEMAKGVVLDDNCQQKFLCLYFYSQNNTVSTSINKLLFFIL